MSINQNSSTVVHFIADGVVKEFNFPFRIFAKEDIDIYVNEVLLNQGYEVEIEDESGGKVIFNQAPAINSKITIIRNLEIKRTSDFQEGGAFRAKVINHELDYQVASIQQLDEKIERAMIYPPYGQEKPNLTLPFPSAGKALVWNQEANGLENSTLEIDTISQEIVHYANETKQSEYNAELSKINAIDSASKAKQSENNAKLSEEKAAQYAESASFGNIGDIKYTARTDVPNGGVWCDGAEYTQAMFPDVYQMLVDGKLSSTDYTTFESTVSANGSCGMFALDTATTSFKVPLLKDVYIKAGDIPSMFGAESLPNIKGEISEIFGNNTTASGAIKYTQIQNSVISLGSSGQKGKIEIDASLSSSAYKDSAKVNPDHVVYKAYVVLYSKVLDDPSSVNKAYVWAEGTDEEVQNLGGIKSAKGWAEASENLNFTDITNCITKIPQDIKLELSNGTLILKAGSKVYVPNGIGVFDEVTIQRDVSRDTFGSKSGSGYLVFYVTTDGTLSYDINNKGGSSGTSLVNGWFYKTDINKIIGVEGGAENGRRTAFPICSVTLNNGVITSIDQVFNGFGYIGSTVFALPDVEGLIPNGRNTDGSLNNSKFVTDRVTTLTRTSTNTQTIVINTQIGYPNIDTWSIAEYDSDKNINYRTDTKEQVPLCLCGVLSRESGIITSFSPKNVFQAVDKSAYYYLEGIDKNIDYVVESKINTDGSWYRKYKSGWLAQGGKFETGADVTKTLTLLKPYKDTNYQIGYIGCGSNTNSTGSSWKNLQIYPETTTTAKYVAINYPRDWIAYGQGV